ncbi:TPA: FtsX-like permease family protein [Streptococcus suis]|uniref:FtsX-like permease family protein n=1 Tax=Streptococcus parasuis TaxID=1501662 RepID=UPI00237967E4|nr:FtsX-like permease family protein [Streptococcus parasuis]HEM3607759.1 FtsX-like permease family protein [Streptococcus suis]WDN58088.1 FtsX-like permease family protein [Streptococcus parasuis]WDN59905.1 FtsX-like permease family protein [Streptococcus parasuis]HEM3616017.1 FtsX-like permease family protein [Streptococcus suis]HEM3617758.1 FtsX-like permease family protein [Streptococcus suis]
MFGLCFRLALTNLKKNRRLYYPYAIMTIVSTAISYIFASLAFHPDLGQVKGAKGVTQVLGFGMIVVMLAVAIMVLYANSFVMKQRSKEFGVYSILGLEKKHLLLMTFLENVVYSTSTILTGLLLGLALDKLFYALLLKTMQMPVVLTSVFQLKNVAIVLAYLYGIFILVSLVNIGKLGLTDSLKLVQGKKRGDKKTGFLWLQTLLALILLGTGYVIAQLVTSPIQAIPSFFGATLLVILGTYLLFQAGVISLLNWLKNRQTYYYKPDNFISVSNLIFRMRKNALGLATITILSTMFLVTMVGGLNIYIGGKDYIANQNPNDYSIDVVMEPTTSKTQVEEWADAILEEAKIPVESKVVYPYQQAYFSNVTNQQVAFLSDEKAASIDFSDLGVGFILDQASYEKMTGQKLELEADQVAIYSKVVQFQAGQTLAFDEKEMEVAQVLSENVTLGHLPDHVSFIVSHYLIVVVQDLTIFENQTENHYYMGFESSLSEEEQVDSQETFLSGSFESELWESNILPNRTNAISLAYRAYATRNFFSFAGSLFFIGLLLSLTFLMAVVLVIYFKQISEGYEDRDRFIIMTKVGLDENQARQSIRKQLLMVFFLPILLAIVHLGFAYKMLSAILVSIGVVNMELMLHVTIGICLVYFLLYLMVFVITTRTYKQIVS